MSFGNYCRGTKSAGWPQTWKIVAQGKFENTLEISGENAGNLVSQNVATLKKDGVPASPPYQGKPCPLGFSCAVSKQFDAGRQNVQT